MKYEKKLGLSDAFWTNEFELLFRIVFPIILEFTLESADEAIKNLGILEGGVSWDLINDAAVQWVQHYYFDLVKDITESSRNFIKEQMVEWLQSGEPLKDLEKRLQTRGMFGRVRAQMIAATETTRAYARGNYIAWKESGIVKGKKWATARDDKVCPICLPLHGMEIGLDQDFNAKNEDGEVIYTGFYPPAHVNCRCGIRPVLKESSNE